MFGAIANLGKLKNLLKRCSDLQMDALVTRGNMESMVNGPRPYLKDLLIKLNDQLQIFGPARSELERNIALVVELSLSFLEKSLTTATAHYEAFEETTMKECQNLLKSLLVE